MAGSHDFSASGKTFLDVLEKAGFCKNIEDSEVEEDGKIRLKPHMHGNIAIYGYPGRKSGMEIEDLRKVYFNEIHPFTIFMAHTTIKDIVGTIPMESIEKQKLPLANYYALGHIHQRFKISEANSHYIYPGPTFPNNFQELVDLNYGGFQLVEVVDGNLKTKNIQIPLKEVAYILIEINDGLTATQKIISELDKFNLKNKIVLLRLKGVLTQGKTGDIHFNEIEEFIRKKEAYVFLRNISSVQTQDIGFETASLQTEDMEDIELKIIGEYSQKNPGNFTKYLPQLMTAFSIEKNEDEKSFVFEDRLLSELKNILKLSGVI